MKRTPTVQPLQGNLLMNEQRREVQNTYDKASGCQLDRTFSRKINYVLKVAVALLVKDLKIYVAIRRFAR
jgi:hypothetical protein